MSLPTHAGTQAAPPGADGAPPAPAALEQPLRVDPSRERLAVGDAVPVRFDQLDWRARLAHIEETMRTMSGMADPAAMVQEYARRMRGTVRAGHTIALSRRGLDRPQVRITRSTLWPEQPDPWAQRDRLPVLDRGVFSEVIWGDKPVLTERYEADPSDPAYEYLRHARSWVAIPHFEDGVGLNMVVHTSFEEGGFAPEKFPDLVLTSNLFGRATKNLVLSQELRRAYQSLDAELRTVQDIQMSLLPAEPPAIRGLAVGTHYQTSKRAGGDYYDFFDLGSGRWAIIVADVSGHGTPAAVLMAIVHAIAHLMPTDNGGPRDPHQAMDFINRALAARYTRTSGAFVTGIYAVYDEATRTLRWANAGHPSPVLLRKDGSPQPLDHPAPGLPLGILEDTEYATHEATLERGQTLLIYTDGITEAFNASHEMYGDRRMVEALRRGAARAASDEDRARAVVASIVEDVGAFAGLGERSDDRTLLALAAH